MESPILQKRNRDIVTVTLNRPKKGNSLNVEAASQLETLFREIQQDSSCKALILRGAGERFFCTGADLVEMKTESKRKEIVDLYASLLSLLSSLPILTAAFVNGDAVGGGFGLLSACKYLLICDEAKLGVPGIQSGLIPYALLPTLLPRLGTRATSQLLLGGKLLSVEQFHQLCVPFEKVTRKDFDSRAKELILAWEEVKGETLISLLNNLSSQDTSKLKSLQLASIRTFLEKNQNKHSES